MVRVNMTAKDLYRAVKHAELRVLESAFQARKDRFYSRHDTELQKQQKEIDGVLGELAVIKYLGIPTGPRLNVYHELADVGDDLEVRATRRLDSPLIVRPNDEHKRRFILAVVSDYYVDLKGWIAGTEALRDDWRANPNNAGEAWFVPQGALKRMEVLYA
jgi:hypothetical protein